MSLSAAEKELVHALRHFIERIEWFSIGRTPEEGLETDKVRLLLAQWDEQVVPHLSAAQDAHIQSELRKVTPVIATMRAAGAADVSQRAAQTRRDALSLADAGEDLESP